MTAQAAGSLETFRDPAGSLSITDERVVRTVRREFAADVLRFLRSDLALAWMEQGRMVATTVLDDAPGDALVLEHERVFFPTYPWEWTPGQWIAAAGLTLDLCEESLSAGLVLKDATPHNVLFSGPRPVFVDVLSFEARHPESPIWLAYGQFVRTFLLPLAAHKYLGWPLAASLHKRDGYEPADLYPYLSLNRRWQSPLRSIVTMPALLEKKGSGNTAKATAMRQNPEVALSVLRRTLRSLRSTLAALAPEQRSSRWSRYPETAHHYSAEDHAKKQAFVTDALQLAQPRNVLDLGANTGVYSRLAAESGANVIAWDTDVAALDLNWKKALASSAPILPMVADVARPTPAAGWRNCENLSLLDRVSGRIDCVIMLGLIHHLLLADQIPLPSVAELISELTQRWAIVEWVPATDSQFVSLCRGRERLYSHLNEAAFQAAFDPYFSCRKHKQLSNQRSLWLFEAR